MLIWLPAILTGLFLIIFLAGRVGLFKGSPPGDLGVRDGRLKPPSNTDNSVSSQASLYPDHPQRNYSAIDPISLVNGDGNLTITGIIGVIEGMDRAEVVKREPDYLHAQFTSKGLQFIDDAEFWFDPEQNVIQARSAARLGRKDFGMNRAHIEAVRSALSANASD